jgi:hypothetical protein
MSRASSTQRSALQKHLFFSTVSHICPELVLADDRFLHLKLAPNKGHFPHPPLRAVIALESWVVETNALPVEKSMICCSLVSGGRPYTACKTGQEIVTIAEAFSNQPIWRLSW